MTKVLQSFHTVLCSYEQLSEENAYYFQLRVDPYSTLACLSFSSELQLAQV